MKISPARDWQARPVSHRSQEEATAHGQLGAPPIPAAIRTAELNPNRVFVWAGAGGRDYELASARDAVLSPRGQ